MARALRFPLRRASDRWYKKYTPQECARLCSKISDFYGKDCTHFSRQWITTSIEEHHDHCGRDGDRGIRHDVAPTGEWGSAGVGTGSYRFRGQCIFFSSDNDECCSTKAAWREAGTDTDSSYCQGKYGERADWWDNKHRSWRLKNSTFTPTGAWPVTSRGRRRLSSTRPEGTDPEQHSHVHELIFPNGSTFWAVEDVTAGAVVGDIHGSVLAEVALESDESWCARLQSWCLEAMDRFAAWLHGR